jgi:septum formation protein
MSEFLTHQPLILASGSLGRQKLLQSLGLQFDVIPSGVDEEQVKNTLKSADFIELARALARAKALFVSENYLEHYVIAADQICTIDKQYLDKPGNHATAIKHLRLLRGKTHQQIAACCIAKAGKIIWESQEIASLTMRNLSDNAIEAYLQLDKPYQSCGAYNYEGRAKWLFQQVTGSDCTIVGLPLIPLMQAFLANNIVTL